MSITSWAINTYYPKGQTYQNTDGYYYVSFLSGTFTATLTSTSAALASITGINASGGNNNLYIGMAVFGTGIPLGTFITAITGSSYAPTGITLNNAATSSGVTALTFNGYYSGASYDVSTRDTNNSTLDYITDLSDTFGEWRLKLNQVAINDIFSKPMDLVPGVVVTANAQIAKAFRLGLTVSVTTFNLNNLKIGEHLTLYITQGAAAYTVAGWTSNTQSIKWSSSTVPTITTAASKIDVITFKNDGNFIYGSISQNY